MRSSRASYLLAKPRRVLLLILLLVLSTVSLNTFGAIPRVAAEQATLQVTVKGYLGANLPGVLLSVYNYYSLVATGSTDSTGNFNFTLTPSNEYTIIASATGYHDYLSIIFVGSGHRTITLDPAYYTGSVLAGAYATQPRYNPGDSAKLAVWIYNKNATFAINITRAEVRFPWFSDYGSSSIGNMSLPGLPHQIQPLSGLNLTATFSIPSDSRAGASVTGGHVYFVGTAQAWKTQWTMTPSGPDPSLVLTTANIDGHTCTEFGCYSSLGFAPSFGVAVSFPTYDTSGTPMIILFLEIVIGILVVNVAVAAITLTRLKSPAK